MQLWSFLGLLDRPTREENFTEQGQKQILVWFRQFHAADKRKNYLHKDISNKRTKKEKQRMSRRIKVRVRENEITKTQCTLRCRYTHTHIQTLTPYTRSNFSFVRFVTPPNSEFGVTAFTYLKHVTNKRLCLWNC